MTTRVAVVQMRGAIGRTDENRARTVSLVERAASLGARLVVLPELAVSGYTVDRGSLRAASERIDGPSVSQWIETSRRTGALVAGGFCERDGDRLYNSAVLVSGDEVLLHYRKLHLFDSEKLVFTPGDRGLGVAETPLGTIGLCVCYDLRFVEVMRLLALQGADIAAVPTAWVGGFDTGRKSGEMIDQARGALLQANLNQMFVLCASQCGEEAGTRFLGSSLVADPYGRALLGPMDGSSEDIGVVAIEPDQASRAQKRSELIRPRDDRRTDVYGLRLGAETY